MQDFLGKLNHVIYLHKRVEDLQREHLPWAEREVQTAVVLHLIFCCSLLALQGSDAFPCIKVLERLDTPQCRF